MKLPRLRLKVYFLDLGAGLAFRLGLCFEGISASIYCWGFNWEFMFGTKDYCYPTLTADHLNIRGD